MWIQTRTGRKFDFDDIHSSEIDIEDIAYSLAHQTRFTGHAGAYTIAQHCCHVSDMCKDYPLAGLLHDAHEAYIGDVSTPLKKALGFSYRNLEVDVWFHVSRSLGVGFIIPDEVHEVDKRMLVTEAQFLFHYTPLDNWTEEYGEPYDWGEMIDANLLLKIWEPWQAKRGFLERYERLKIS